MSFLKLNKLLVTKESDTAYYEVFHEGINIIRGDNSSGKSTISNFIFFALGGEFTNWLPEAVSCNYVYAEVELNGVTLTFKREIEAKQMKPMSIFFGKLEDGLKSNYEGWQTYPYRKSSNAESFSQIIFKALDFPEVSTDNQESITVNQILRLIYIDQLSALDSLMRNEDFDSPLIRTAIGNLLLGTYDDNLLGQQMILKQKERELSEIKKQIYAIKEVFNNSLFEFDKEKIKSSLDEKKEQLKRVLNTLKEPDAIVESVKRNDVKNDIKQLRQNLIQIKNEYDTKLRFIDKNEISLIDTSDFIKVLQSKLIAIKESLNSRDILGAIPLQYCPVCLEKLDDNIEENHCKLCKQEVKENPGKSKLLRMQLEIEMQIKESQKNLKAKENKLRELEASLKEISRSLIKAQADYDVYINQSRTSLESKFDQLLEQKGKLNAEIDFLGKQIQLIESYENYENDQKVLKTEIDKLKEDIKHLADLQHKKSYTAFSRIQYYALELLKGDGAYEEKFQNGQCIKIDFTRNSFYLDGRNRFSASSMVLLKNCVRFAIFFASLELDYFRYPKFILCDNIEDKGMVEARSKNFQRNIVRLANSKEFKEKDFQIIMTTSMIEEELDIQKYTVGEKYTQINKSLVIL
jgi:hypothetical protein